MQCFNRALPPGGQPFVDPVDFSIDMSYAGNPTVSFSSEIHPQGPFLRLPDSFYYSMLAVHVDAPRRWAPERLPRLRPCVRRLQAPPHLHQGEAIRAAAAGRDRDPPTPLTAAASTSRLRGSFASLYHRPSSLRTLASPSRSPNCPTTSSAGDGEPQRPRGSRRTVATRPVSSWHRPRPWGLCSRAPAASPSTGSRTTSSGGTPMPGRCGG